MKGRRAAFWPMSLAVLALAGLLMLPGLAVASKKEPPPPPWHLHGPALVGTLRLELNSDSTVTLTIEVDNRGVPYTYTGQWPLPQGADFAAVTAADLEESWLDYSISSQLGSSDYLTINAVTRFKNTGSVIKANIIILSGVSQ